MASTASAETRRTAAARRVAEAAPALAAGGAVVAASAFLLARLAPEVRGRPLFSDEAVAGLVAARPLPEAVKTAVWERGGAPLHFLLGHVTLAIDPSAFALRWLSVVFALATVVVCFDLGRRLAGPVAGATAALVASASTLLGIYGSFGRMYALFAFAGALAVDLFVRALEERTASAALAAAAAAWLLPASHPYGAIPVAAEAVVALALWRGRPLRPALPVFAVALAMIPLALGDLRLAGRFDLGADVGQSRPVLSKHELPGYFLDTFRSFAGGHGWAFVLLSLLGLVGVAALALRRPAFTAFAALAAAAPFLFLLLARTNTPPYLSTRHLIFLLPVWAALIGAGVERAAREWGRLAPWVAVAAVALAAALAPAGGEADPRKGVAGEPEALAAPVAWLDSHVKSDDVLFPYSSLYLAALPTTRHATVLTTRGPGDIVGQGLERVKLPVGSLFISAPLGPNPLLDVDRMQTELGDRFDVHLFGSWLLVEAKGPFADRGSMLASGVRIVDAVETASDGRIFLNRYRRPLCVGLRSLGATCPAHRPKTV
jgi:hypothetical protein